IWRRSGNSSARNQTVPAMQVAAGSTFTHGAAEGNTVMPRPLPPTTPGGLSPAYLAQLLGTDAPIILEIGANDDTHTLQFLSLFPKAKLYAFEPDSRALAKFKARINDPRVRLFEVAIGAKDGSAEFHVSSGLPEEMPPEDRAQYPDGWDQSGSLR